MKFKVKSLIVIVAVSFSQVYKAMEQGHREVASLEDQACLMIAKKRPQPDTIKTFNLPESLQSKVAIFTDCFSRLTSRLAQEINAEKILSYDSIDRLYKQQDCMKRAIIDEVLKCSKENGCEDDVMRQLRLLARTYSEEAKDLAQNFQKGIKFAKGSNSSFLKKFHSQVKNL
ncbi:MAG TPA: hypothetical protein VHA52_07330, partial [Candidatus Babeliaceae bacterium]|nr:hypothetical protein [Candidatus Babeliaceae bacterium]